MGIIPELGFLIMFPIQVILIPLMLIFVMLGADLRGTVIVWITLTISAGYGTYYILKEWAKEG